MVSYTLKSIVNVILSFLVASIVTYFAVQLLISTEETDIEYNETFYVFIFAYVVSIAGIFYFICFYIKYFNTEIKKQKDVLTP